LKWENVGSSFRVYITGAQPPGGTVAAVNYQGTAVVSEEDKTSTISATVFDESSNPVTNGTTVYFEFRGNDLGCVLSSLTATTSDGVAEISLIAGSQAGIVEVRAIVGGIHAEVRVEITGEDAEGGNFARFGSSGGWSWETEVDRRERTGNETCTSTQNDDNDDDGSVSGTRRLVGCEGEPLAGAVVTMNGVTSLTDPDGFFTFSNGSTGSNEITTGGKTFTFQISPKDSESRGGFKITCIDNETNAITYEGPA
jgi:hypothetical protein